MNRAYGLRPESRIDYNQFEIDADGRTLYWTPGHKKIPITATRGSFRFLALSSLAKRYGEGGTNALRRSLGFTDYTSKLSRSAVKALQQADKALPSDLESVEMKDLPVIADSARRSPEDVETALSTITNPPIDTAWVNKAGRELAGLKRQ